MNTFVMIMRFMFMNQHFDGQKMRKILSIIYFSLFFLLLVVFLSQAPPKRPSHHRRLVSDLGFDLPLELDPAPAADSPSPWEELSNMEGRLNVTQRIIYLFPRIDVHPPDGFISVRELANWNLEQALREALQWSEKEFVSHDQNRDGFVSFAEYDHSSSLTAVGNDLGWWNEAHFNASDADGDGLLNKHEFNDFLHPANSRSPKLLLWLCADVLSDRDQDKDGKLNFKEFFPRIFDLVMRGYGLSNVDDDEKEAMATSVFSELDIDNDRYLSARELLPIIGKFHPTEAHIAKEYAKYIISEIDNDNDGLLTLDDMVESPYAFYTTVFGPDEMDYYPYDDEFPFDD